LGTQNFFFGLFLFQCPLFFFLPIKLLFKPPGKIGVWKDMVSRRPVWGPSNPTWGSYLPSFVFIVQLSNGDHHWGPPNGNLTGVCFGNCLAGGTDPKKVQGVLPGFHKIGCFALGPLFFFQEMGNTIWACGGAWWGTSHAFLAPWGAAGAHLAFCLRAHPTNRLWGKSPVARDLGLASLVGLGPYPTGFLGLTLSKLWFVRGFVLAFNPRSNPPSACWGGEREGGLGTCCGQGLLRGPVLGGVVYGETSFVIGLLIFVGGVSASFLSGPGRGSFYWRWRQEFFIFFPFSFPFPSRFFFFFSFWKEEGL